MYFTETVYAMLRRGHREAADWRMTRQLFVSYESGIDNLESGKQSRTPSAKRNAKRGC